MKRLIVLVLIVGFAFGTWYAVSQIQPHVPPPPEVDLGELHPLVAETIQDQLANVKSNPHSGSVWGEFGMTLYAHGFKDEARTCLAQAGTLDEDEFRWPYMIGFSLEETDYAGAIAAYRAAIERRADYIPLRIRLAQLLLREGKLAESEAVLTAGGEPANPYLLVTRARLAVIQKEYEQAEALLLRAIEQTGWSPRPAYLELVRLAQRKGDSVKAAEYQQQLKAFPAVAKMEFPDPVLEEIRSQEGLSKKLAERADVALARGDFSTAIGLYEEFLTVRSDLPTAHLNLAHAYAQAGRFPEAIATFERVFDRFGDLLTAHLGLAATYEQMGQSDAAISRYRKVLELKPNHKQVWFSLGLLYERQKNLDEAILCYREAVSADPSYAQAQLALGVALLERGENAEARVHILRAVNLVPGDPVPLGYLKQVDQRLSEQGKSTETE